MQILQQQPYIILGSFWELFAQNLGNQNFNQKIMQKIKKYWWVNFDKNFKEQYVWNKLKPITYGRQKRVAFALEAYKTKKIHIKNFTTMIID